MVAAVRERDGREVAIKIVHRDDASSCRRLTREAEALRAIGPPYVPELFDTGSLSDGSPFLVLEKLTIPSLDSKLGDPMGRIEFAALANPLFTAVDVTHTRGFVHRDLKPENIFVSGTLFTARLIDFGLTKSSDARSSSSDATMTGMLLGTPVYMSPEQCEGRGDVDHRADIYALGVILYEMLTGRPPFFGKPAQVRGAHINRRPSPPSHVEAISPAFDQVLLRCLAKEPERRFETIRDLRRALSEAMERESDVVRAPVPAVRRPAESGRQQLVGLIFFDTGSTSTVMEQLSALGGKLVYVDGERHVAAFGLGSSGNPIERAFESAKELVERGVAPQVVVDRDRAKIHRSPDGTRRVLTAAFRNESCFPRHSDPSGVLVTTRAAEGLGPLQSLEIPQRDGIRRTLPNSPTPSDGDLPGAESLVGRISQLEQLLDSARLAVSERRPTIATVTAEIGHGKTHLGGELTMRLRDQLVGARIIELRAREPLGIEHDRLLQNLLRSVLRLPTSAPADHGRGVLGEQLGEQLASEVWPAVALVLGWLPPDAPQVRKLSAAPSALRSAAAQATGEAIHRLAGLRPVCVVIDDAHYADETTLDALEYATLAEHHSSVWVCVLADPVFERARPVWASRAASAVVIELPPLGAGDAGLLCRRLLRPAINVPEQIVERLVEWTGGNPLLLQELIGGIHRRGLIRRHARGDSWYLATDELEHLPEMLQVEWLAERELGALSAELASSARLTALLGSEFTVEEAEGVLNELEEDGLGELFPLDAWVSISRLLGQGLLTARQDGLFEFRHPLIRDMVVRSTPTDLRQQIHRAAFRLYRDVSPLGRRYRLRQLAWHAEHSGLVGAAAATYIHLAEQAQTRHAYVDAELMYSHALALMPPDQSPARMRCFNGRGLMHYRLSRFADALVDLERAMTIAERLGDLQAKVELLLDQAEVVDWMQDFQRSSLMVHQAQMLSEEVDSVVVDARLSAAMGRALLRASELDEANDLLVRAIRLAEGLGDHGYETLVISLMLQGGISALVSEFEQATASLDRAVELCEEHGDKMHLAAALNNRLTVWVIMKETTRAVEDGLRAQRLGREIGQGMFEYVTAYNLAELFYFAGDIAAARPHIERAVELEPSSSSRPLAELLHARILAYDRDDTAARAVLERIRSNQGRAREAGDKDALLSESEQLLHEMSELATQGASREVWNELQERAEEALQPVERAEMLEFGAVRGPSDDRVRALLEAALGLSQESSHLIEERIAARLASLG